MILLLYCSFSVPLSIAFPEDSSSASTSSVQDYVELSFDVIFMMDIALTFVTAYDNQVHPVTHAAPTKSPHAAPSAVFHMHRRELRT